MPSGIPHTGNPCTTAAETCDTTASELDAATAANTATKCRAT